MSNNATMLASALAYSSFFAIPSVLLVTVGVFTLVAGPDTITNLMAHFNTVMPGQATELLGGEAEAYGKGALVGIDGEVEHGSAIIHNLRFGDRVREPVAGTSLLPSAEKRGPPGAPLDLAIKHKTDHRVRSHHQTFEVRIPDAPGPDEIVIWVALASSGRPQSRLGEFGSELAAAS